MTPTVRSVEVVGDLGVAEVLADVVGLAAGGCFAGGAPEPGIGHL